MYTKVEMWKKRWKIYSVQNVLLLDNNNPELRVPGFERSKTLRSTLNRSKMKQGKCKYLMDKRECPNPLSVFMAFNKQYVIH